MVYFDYNGDYYSSYSRSGLKLAVVVAVKVVLFILVALLVVLLLAIDTFGIAGEEDILLAPLVLEDAFGITGEDMLLMRGVIVGVALPRVIVGVLTEVDEEKEDEEEAGRPLSTIQRSCNLTSPTFNFSRFLLFLLGLWRDTHTSRDSLPTSAKFNLAIPTR